jgi:hypothetical protein
MTTVSPARTDPFGIPLSRAKGRSIVQSTARINVWEGSIRSGKTVASLIRWLKFIAEAPERGELVMIGNVNRAGYRRADLEAAVPPELLLAARSTDPVDPNPTTGPAT